MEGLEQVSGGSFWKNEYWCPECKSRHVYCFDDGEGVCFDCGVRMPNKFFIH